jgi:hypothetical protein
MPSSGMLRHVAFVRTDVSEESIASIIRVTGICDLETLAVTSNRRTKRRFLQEPLGVTSRKTAFSIAATMSRNNINREDTMCSLCGRNCILVSYLEARRSRWLTGQ